jgi:restriction system protein
MSRRERAKRSGQNRRVNNKANKSSIFKLLTQTHWMVSVILGVAIIAAITYWESTVTVQRKELAELLDFAFLGVKAFVGVYFVFAAIGSVFRQRKRQRLLDAARKSDDLIKALSDIDWYEFELLVGQMFRERGYSVVEGEGNKDGGVDLTLRRRGKTYLVQCKHWKGNVGVGVVRELFGVMNMTKAHHAYVVCSGQFTRDASDFAERTGGVSLIGIDQLQEILNRRG